MDKFPVHMVAGVEEAIEEWARWCFIFLNTAYLLKESFGQLWSYEREGMPMPSCQRIFINEPLFPQNT